MAAPAGGIFSGSMPAYPCIIQNTLDPAPQAGCCFGLCLPDRPQRRHNKGGIDGLDRETAKDRVGIGFKSREPLCGVFPVFPGWGRFSDIGFCTLLEWYALGSFELGGLP